ncbi:amidohydrolase [Algibacter mikhailovii]|uniref:Amidohydrolase n=1 Tax=Algibacter mikhailovii TaxID=425498 RepID=A0A918V5S4_9FLAO|nr:amidohydrolase family protein [Algibacter mikhailovii]GGZ71814.1 amidohydrolase [Algibacter mikhailovii]
MKKIQFILSFLLVGLLIACNSDGKNNSASSAAEIVVADKVLQNGTIETMNPDQPTAEAVAMKDGKIVFVGSNNNVKDFVGDNTEVIDLGGKYVTPGFIDAHTHVIASSFTTSGVNVQAAQSIDEMLAIIKEYSDKNPDLKVVQAVSYRPAALGRNPSAADLDKLGLDKPVVALGNSSHDGVFNTVALKLAKIDNNVKDNVPGVVYWERDASGNITGAAIETQWMQTYVDIGAWIPEIMVPETMNYMQGYLASQGVTSVLVPGVITPNFGISSEATRQDFEDIMKILTTRIESGEAKMRINTMPFMKLLDADPDDYVPFAVRMREKYNNDMLRVNSLKMHADGHYNDRAMSMSEPYNKDEGDDLPYLAPLAMSADVIHATIMKATSENINVVLHADGTRVIQTATNSIIASKKAYPEATTRHRMDHISFINPETAAQIMEYNIPLNATPIFTNAVENGKDGEAVLKKYSKETVERTMGLYMEMAQNGANVSLGGDPPGSVVEEAYPVWLFQQAMTLEQPGRPELGAFPQNRKPYTIDDALKSMTVNAAWQLQMEDKIGSIEVGKYADFAVFNKSLRDIKPENLVEEAKCVGTMLYGEYTHNDGM